MPDGPQTLAARIRAKYPGEYDDIADIELERRVLAKYPEYADLPRTEATLTREQKARGPLDEEGPWDTAVRTMSTAGTLMPGAGPLLKRDTLPTTGAVVGGIAGPKGAGAGAAAGSVLSSMIRQAESGRLPTMGDVASGAGTALARGASAATLGAVGGKALPVAAKAIDVGRRVLPMNIMAGSGAGAALMSGNLPAAAMALAAPVVAKGAARAVTRAAQSPLTNSAMNLAGRALGPTAANAFKAALLQALSDGSASTETR